MTGGAWADSIYTFFNNSLFATSSSVAALGSDFVGVSSSPHNTWEEDFERVMETGGDLPEVDAPRAISPLTDEEDTPPSAVRRVANLNAPNILAPESISAAMQGLAVADSQDRELLPPTPALNDSGSRAPGMLTNDSESGPGALVQKPKPKPKPRRKTKGGARAEDLMLGAADEDLALVRRSGRAKK